MKFMRMITAFGVSLVVLLGHAQEIPVDESGFTQHVAKQVQEEVNDSKVIIKAPLTLSIGELQANLDRIYGFCRSNESECGREISNYVNGIAQLLKETNAPPAKEDIRIVVRTSEYVNNAQGSMPKDAPAIQPRPLVEGLVQLPILDSPRFIRMLTVKDNEIFGLTPDEVFSLGISNLQNELKPIMEVAKVTKHGQIGNLVGNSFDSSRLAMHETWEPLANAQGGTLIVTAPVTDAIFYIGEDTPDAIDALRTLVNDIMRKVPNPLSNILLRWTPYGWEVVQ